MNKESNVIKEFREKDVQRMRNIITGKTGDKTQVSAGYEKQQKDYKEGDVWTDSFGKTWTIKNGIKQSKTKNDNLKKLVILPMSCPKCSNLMKVNDLNKKMYSIHNMCFDCVIKMETDIKLTGKWEEYEQSQVKGNVKTSLEDFEQVLDTWYKEKDTFVTEQGDIETWTSGNKAAIYNKLKEDINKAKHQVS